MKKIVVFLLSFGVTLWVYATPLVITNLLEVIQPHCQHSFAQCWGQRKELRELRDLRESSRIFFPISTSPQCHFFPTNPPFIFISNLKLPVDRSMLMAQQSDWPQWWMSVRKFTNRQVHGLHIAMSPWNDHQGFIRNWFDIWSGTCL